MDQKELLFNHSVGEELPRRDLSTIVSSVITQINAGYDFFDCMRAINLNDLKNCAAQDLDALCEFAPIGRKLKSLHSHDIHGMIARWTPSRFHTAPIQEVVCDIQRKCIDRQIGLSVYNSNLNPHDSRAANDPYILLITESKILFLDLNRKISYHYLYEQEDAKHDSNGNLR